jgi:SAM-dependent methyltransferase
MIRIEQEGQLALYDVSGVLWPAGYLLGLCLYDPLTCGVPEIINFTRYSEETSADLAFALELGSGVGFPSIAFAKSMSHHLSSSNVSVCESRNTCPARRHTPVVVATDSSRSSLGLIASNAYRNNAGHLLDVFEVDHMNSESISLLLERFYPSGGGFDLIFGSSLQGFFDESSRTDAVIWRSLDRLLSKTNSAAIVLLAHVRSGDERIEVPSATALRDHASNLFEIVRRISGDVFHMRTRDGRTSDFEIVVLRRQK